MRVVLDGHVYEGPEPSGRAGHELYQRVWRVLVALGYGDLPPFGDRLPAGHAARIISAMRAVGASPHFGGLFDATFSGWTRDGAPLSWDAVGDIYQGARWEPSSAAFRVWVQCAFFGVSGTGAPGGTPTEP